MSILSIWCNNNFKHLNVIIMMRMTCVSFMQYLWKRWHDKIWGICHRGKNERVPWQRIRNDATATYRLSGSPRGYRCKRKLVWVWHARWWGAPEYLVPTCRRQGNEELAKNISDTVQPRASHTSLNIRSRASSRWLYLRSMQSGWFGFVEGSRGSIRSVMVVEVVVLSVLDGSCTRMLQGQR